MIDKKKATLYGSYSLENVWQTNQFQNVTQLILFDWWVHYCQ